MAIDETKATAISVNKTLNNSVLDETNSATTFSISDGANAANGGPAAGTFMVTTVLKMGDGTMRVVTRAASTMLSQPLTPITAPQLTALRAAYALAHRDAVIITQTTG